MKSLIGSPLLFLALLAATATHAAEGETVVSPTKRQDLLSKAKTLLASPSAAVVGKDPFHSEETDIQVSVGSGGGGSSNNSDKPPPEIIKVGPRTGRDLLQAIAASPLLKPSGYYVLGGQPTLVFGQKRLKAGGILTINFEGNDYPLEIASIVPPNFTLRLNREEFTRTIK